MNTNDVPKAHPSLLDALRRQNEKAQQMKLSEGFEERVMRGMKNEESRFAQSAESKGMMNDESRFARNDESMLLSNPEGNSYSSFSKYGASLRAERVIRHSSFVIRHSSFKKIAAVLLTAVFLGGLAWAFVPRFITPKANAPQSAEATTPRLDGEREGVLPVSFNDMRLDSILSVVATHYHHAVCFRDSSLRALHFYTTWDDSQPIDSFLTTLDEFEGLRLSRERDTIFVESETGEEAQ